MKMTASQRLRGVNLFLKLIVLNPFDIKPLNPVEGS